MNDDDVRQLLKVAFDYSFKHHDWVSPLEEVMDGLTAGQAIQHHAANDKCIWEIVLHMAVWNENIVARVRTGATSRPMEGAWPALPPCPDVRDWEDAKARLCPVN